MFHDNGLWRMVGIYIWYSKGTAWINVHPSSAATVPTYLIWHMTWHLTYEGSLKGQPTLPPAAWNTSSLVSNNFARPKSVILTMFAFWTASTTKTSAWHYQTSGQSYLTRDQFASHTNLPREVIKHWILVGTVNIKKIMLKIAQILSICESHDSVANIIVALLTC